MSEIGRLWAGRVFGTNTGNLFVELDQTEAGVSGTLRLLDTLYGLSIYEITGSIDGSTLEFEGEPKQVAPGVETGRFVAKATLTPQGHFRGQWQTSIGTAGTFELYPHATHQADQTRGPTVQYQSKYGQCVNQLALFGCTQTISVNSFRRLKGISPLAA